MAHGLMVLSGLLAFVLVAAVLGDRSERIEVAVAGRDIAAGAQVAPDLIEAAELPTDSGLTDKIVTVDQINSGAWVATQPLAVGDPIRRSDLAEAEAMGHLRSMSVPVSRASAVGGGLRVGDRVDVIDVIDGVANYVLVDAQVLEVSEGRSSGGITAGASSDLFVVVEVDARQALRVAEALVDGRVDVVRSTGAEPISDSASSSSSVGSGG